MNINQLIGANIKRLRESKSFKQASLAKKLQISVQTLSAIENGKQNITLIQLERIAFILEIKITTLFTSEPKIFSIEEKERISQLVLKILSDYQG